MKKVSIDFDSTLTMQHVEDFAKSLLLKGIEVHITTSRFEVGKKKFLSETHNDDLFNVADRLGIPKEHIHFTNMDDKYNHLDGFIWHLDDDWIELDLLGESDCECIGITHIGNIKWKDECKRLLKV